MSITIGAHTVLPAYRESVELRTADGLALAGALALPPEGRPRVGTVIAVHPLPTHGGSADSHLLRKASWRLPALADIGVLRFNTRGTASAVGTSHGAFDGGVGEGHDLAAAAAFAARRGLANPWLVGWSFGADLAVRYGPGLNIAGAILLSPPLRYVTEEHLAAWETRGRRLIALIPGLDELCPPDVATRRFASAPLAEVIVVPGVKHLWIGEPAVRIALDAIADAVHPGAAPLPTQWDGPYATHPSTERFT
ncbi:MAG: hypothetical protein LBK72_09540 [Bifidobacteriaceae bacterium]|nr:hypothetical protein [Bifidobacteriaceae bacterium]